MAPHLPPVFTMEGTLLREEYRKSLTCTTCMGIFCNPATLPCGHTFCRQPCLRDWIKSCSEMAVPPRCPECRTPCFPYLPPRNVALSAVSMAVRKVTGQDAEEEEGLDSAVGWEAGLEALLASPVHKNILEAALSAALMPHGKERVMSELHLPPGILPPHCPLLSALRRLSHCIRLCTCSPPHVTWAGSFEEDVLRFIGASGGSVHLGDLELMFPPGSRPSQGTILLVEELRAFPSLVVHRCGRVTRQRVWANSLQRMWRWGDLPSIPSTDSTIRPTGPPRDTLPQFHERVVQILREHGGSVTLSTLGASIPSETRPAGQNLTQLLEPLRTVRVESINNIDHAKWIGDVAELSGGVGGGGGGGGGQTSMLEKIAAIALSQQAWGPPASLTEPQAEAVWCLKLHQYLGGFQKTLQDMGLVCEAVKDVNRPRRFMGLTLSAALVAAGAFEVTKMGSTSFVKSRL